MEKKESKATAIESKQRKSADGKCLLYICVENCMFDNVFYTRGQVVEVPSVKEVDQPRLKPLMEDEDAGNAKAEQPMYDPCSENLKGIEMDKVFSGIVGRR